MSQPQKESERFVFQGCRKSAERNSNLLALHAIAVWIVLSCGENGRSLEEYEQQPWTCPST